LGRYAPCRVDTGTINGNEVRNDRVTKLGTDIVEVLMVPVDFSLYGKQPSKVRSIGIVLIYNGSINVIDLVHKIQENVHRVVDESSIGGNVEEVSKVTYALVVLQLIVSGIQITAKVVLFFALLGHQIASVVVDLLDVGPHFFDLPKVVPDKRLFDLFRSDQLVVRSRVPGRAQGRVVVRGAGNRRYVRGGSNSRYVRGTGNVFDGRGAVSGSTV